MKIIFKLLFLLIIIFFNKNFLMTENNRENKFEKFANEIFKLNMDIFLSNNKNIELLNKENIPTEFEENKYTKIEDSKQLLNFLKDEYTQFNNLAQNDKIDFIKKTIENEIKEKRLELFKGEKLLFLPLGSSIFSLKSFRLIRLIENYYEKIEILDEIKKIEPQKNLEKNNNKLSLKNIIYSYFIINFIK